MPKISRPYQLIIEKLGAIRGNTAEEEQREVLSEAADIIADYEAAVAMTADLQKKYEMPEQAVRRGQGFYQCPLCGRGTQEGHTHCHWCGKALRWDRRKRYEQGHTDGKTHQRRRG